MVLCLLALPLFAVLGIFSLKYRKLAKDALECVFMTATLRKCKSGLDDRIKAQITGKMLRFSPKSAGFVYRHYKAISWIVLIIFAWSIYEGSIGVYNYYSYGNCNGPVETGFCMLDPTGKNSKTSAADIDKPTEIIYPGIEDNDPIIGSKDAKLTVIEFGCYMCPYTKKAEPIVKEVIDYYKGKVNFQFKTFTIPKHTLSYKSALAANCAQEEGKYLEYHKLLFEMQESITNESFEEIAKKTGLNVEKFNKCLKAEKYKNKVNDDTLMGISAGVEGTPTFFINKREIVGPKPFRTFKTIIDDELKKIEKTGK